MNIGNTLVAGVDNHFVDHLDNRRRFVADRREIHPLIVIARFLELDVGALEVREDIADTLFVGLVALGDRIVESGLRGHDGTKLAARDDTDIVEFQHIERVGNGHRHDVADLVDREDLVLAGDVDRHFLDDFLVDLHALEANRGRVRRLADHRKKLVLGVGAFGDNDLGQRFLVTDSFFEHFVECVRLDIAGLEQNAAELLGKLVHRLEPLLDDRIDWSRPPARDPLRASRFCSSPGSGLCSIASSCEIDPAR